MIEAEQVARWVWALLAADSGASGVNTAVGGRIYQERPEQGAAFPAITISIVDAPDLLTANGDHVKQDVTLDVAVRGDGEHYDEIGPIAARIFTVLQGAALTGATSLLLGVYAPKLRRVDTTRLQNDTAGKPYSHIVQTFFTEARPA